MVIPEVESIPFGPMRALPRNTRVVAEIGPTLCIARLPGPATTLAPLAARLGEMGTQVYVQAAETATRTFDRTFASQEPVDIKPRLEWLVVSGENPKGVMDAVKKVTQTQPAVKVAVLEDLPGSAQPLVDDLMYQVVRPNLILTSTQSQANLYRTRYDADIIAVGQPRFDALRDLDIPKVRETVREKLRISDDVLVLTYCGARDDGKSGFYIPKDFNSVLLEQTTTLLAKIGNDYPMKKYLFVYKPHPREYDEYWHGHPALGIGKLPANVRLLTMRREAWDMHHVSAAELCLASEAVTLYSASVAEELCFMAATTRGNQNQIPQPIAIWRKENDRIRQRTNPWLSRIHLFPAVSDMRSLKTKLIEHLNGNAKWSREALARFKDDYQGDGPATERAYNQLRKRSQQF